MEGAGAQAGPWDLDRRLKMLQLRTVELHGWVANGLACFIFIYRLFSFVAPCSWGAQEIEAARCSCMFEIVLGPESSKDVGATA